MFIYLRMLNPLLPLLLPLVLVLHFNLGILIDLYIVFGELIRINLIE